MDYDNEECEATVSNLETVPIWARAAELEAENERLRAALVSITKTRCYLTVKNTVCACCRPVATIANDALAPDEGDSDG
jgi:hypothetical protein